MTRWITPWIGGCVLALACLLLAGCASIPLSTLWKMRSFDPADLATVEPRDVRMAERIEPASMRTDPKRSHLELRLTPRGQTAEEVYAFGLRETRVYDSRLVPAADPQWQVFALDDDGIATWRRLRPKLLDIKRRYSKAVFGFTTKTLDAPPPGVDEMIYSVRLQLGLDQAPLVLLDRAPLEIERKE